jgi:peptidoglycan/xylan/chitin deacetylase (PgdA/CDA1 family)
MVVVIVAAAAGLTALSHMAPFPFLFDAFSGKVSVWRVMEPAGRRVVYLTFDDGPNPAVTGELLDLLKDRQVRATFFLIPEHVTEDTAPLVRRMFEEGHGVAQHSGNRWLMTYTPGRLAARLGAEADRIEKLAGQAPCPLFRPHAGWRSVPMMMGVSRRGYRLAGWSWMTWDWNWFRPRTGERVAAQVISNAAPGKIVVIHDGHHVNPRADRRYALEASRRVIDGLRARGFEFASLCP